MLSRSWANRATWWAAWIALLLSLVLTVLAWRLAYDRSVQASQAELQSRVTAIASRIEERVLAYEQLLRGGAGLFAASGDVDRTRWRAFVASLGLASLPGIEGIGYAQWLSPAEVAAHVESVRAEGRPDYRVFPPGARDAYTSIVLLEPLHGRNRRAIGYDMYSEPVRRRAMSRAADSGQPSLSGRVILVQEGDLPRQAGFLLYLPVYRQDAPLETVEQRREALRGWVYAPFRMQDFMRGIFGAGPADLSLEIRDAPEDGALLHGAVSAGSDEQPLSMRVPLRVADRVWDLGVRAVPGGERRWLTGPDMVALGGMTISLLIFGIARTLAGTRSRALSIADRMTEALRNANETLEERVRDRTASLRESNERLGRVNAKLQAMAGAFGAINAPGSLADKVATIATQARGIIECDLSLVMMTGAESGGATAMVGIDSSGSVSLRETERWRRAALDADPEGEALAAGRIPPGSFAHRIHAPLRDSSDRPRGYIVLGRDRDRFTVEDSTVLSQLALLIAGSVSLHETLAREQHARSEAERADRAKDEMLAVVSHELRTPLNAIQGWLHVLRRRRENDLALLDRAVDVIQRNLDTQVQLVDDLLDTARIVSGKFRLELQRLNLVPLLRTAVDVVRPLAEAKQLRLELEIVGDGFDTIGDASRLEQVVWNLLTNAVKFTPAGGLVRVRLERLGYLAQLDVEDNGIGIDPKFLPHVFDRFQQADSSNTRAAGGLGLGLALVQHIVRAHGGQVMVRSEGPGRGTRFTVALPLGTTGVGAPDVVAGADGPALGQAELDADTFAQHGERPLEGLQVLVVEDHADSRELLTDFLAAQGAEVRSAGSGNEALQRMREIPRGARPVLLCDIALPGESGYDVLARIRRLEDDEGLPASARAVALALSAFTREEDRQRSLAAGFLAHLTKPISQSDLLGRLVAMQRDGLTDVVQARD
jgi:signal transduction histidine kinase/CHASE1-domain containing sensor protein/ActR/RegA family two-component response regulator